MGNQYTQEYSYDYKLNIFLSHIEKNCPDWEYVRGYTDSDGRAVLRNKVCGHEKDVSCITVRKMGEATRKQKNLVCKECIRLEKQRKKEKAHKLIEYKQFMGRKAEAEEQMQMKKCSYCGAFYFGFEKDEFCSDECKVQNNKRNANRYKETKRKRCRTEESKYINLVSLYKRDNGICWLCGKPCDMNLDTNDNYYPSIDHVVPVSKGGMDRWDNVRLAHRICNMIKSNMIGMGEIENALTTYSLIPK